MFKRIALLTLTALDLAAQGVSVMFPGPGMLGLPPALVTHVARTGNGTTSNVDTSGCTAIVANVSGGTGATNSTAVVSDSNNNTWAAFAQSSAGTNQVYEQMFYVVHPIVGTGHNFTLTGGNASTLEVACFSGITGVRPLDQSSFANSGISTGSTTFQPGSLTPTNANSLLVAGAAFGNVSLTGIDSAFAITDTQASSLTVNGGSLAYLIQTSATPSNPTWTLGSSAVNANGMIVLIPGGGIPPPSPTLVTHISCATSGCTTSAVDTTGATLLVANVTIFTVGSFTSTLTDSKSNTWTAINRTQSGTSWQGLFYAKNPTVGAGHTFTNVGDSSSTVEVAAFSGISTSAPLISSANATSGGVNVLLLQPGSVTPGSSNSLLVTGVSANVEPSPGLQGLDLGFIVTDTQFVGSPTIGGSMGYLAQAATTATNPTWRITNSTTMNSSIAVFK